MRATSGSWDGEKVILKDQVLEVRNVDSRLHRWMKTPPKRRSYPGKASRRFQTAGEFRLEAIGEPNREVEYGYVLLGLRK